jgi:hypothetical protein
MLPMYEAIANSPQTILSAEIDDTTTTIPVHDASILPAPPNIIVIWTTGAVPETVMYQGVDGNLLTNCVRGFQGTASAWPNRAKVARLITAYDHNTFIANIIKLDQDLATIQTKSGVSSVNGQTGAVTITPVSISAAPATHTHAGGDITGSVASAVLATKLANARTITLAGDVTGSATFDGSANATLTTTVANDSHTHTFTTVDGLQPAISGLQASVTELQRSLETKSESSHLHDGVYEPVISTKKTAFNRDFGTGPNTVCAGNDPRLSNARPPTTHTHTTTIADVVNLQTALNEKAATNHNHTTTDITDLSTYTDAKIAERLGQPSGICSLDAAGKVYQTSLPNLVVTNVVVCNSEVDQLALTIQTGTICVRTDLSKTFIAVSDTNTSMDDWIELLAPESGVLSINGLSGTVNLDHLAIGAAARIHAHTPDDVVGLTAELNEKESKFLSSWSITEETGDLVFSYNGV